jgi:hypothetical protein
MVGVLVLVLGEWFLFVVDVKGVQILIEYLFTEVSLRTMRINRIKASFRLR